MSSNKQNQAKAKPKAKPKGEVAKANTKKVKIKRKNGYKQVQLASRIHKAIGLIKYEKEFLTFNETIEFLLKFYLKRENESKDERT